ncbi:MAG: ABC transporter permease [Halobacteriales archaeon]|nr:ABC transporter permease [Halobacteriales archaeon]
MSALRTFGLMYMRNLRQFPRIPVVLVFGIVMPIIQLLLFGNLFSSIAKQPAFQAAYPGVEYESFIVPAVLLFTIFVGMANSSAALIVDLRTGYFDKLRTTPARPAIVMTARMFAEMTRVALQGTLVLLIAIAFGASVKTGVVGALVMIVLATVFSACIAGLGVMALALKTKSDQATQSAFPLFFVLMFLSSAFQAKELIDKEWLRSVVDINPVNFLIESLRQLMIGVNEGGAMVASYPWEKIGLVLIASAVGAIVFGFVNWRVYRKMIG